jgi:mRNA interferase ChpB
MPRRIGVVRCDRPRGRDLSARHGKKLETMPDAAINEVLAKVGTFLERGGNVARKPLDI